MPDDYVLRDDDSHHVALLDTGVLQHIVPGGLRELRLPNGAWLAIGARKGQNLILDELSPPVFTDPDMILLHESGVPSGHRCLICEALELRVSLVTVGLQHIIVDKGKL